MWIVKVALQRPYTFIVLAILILLMGVFAIERTAIDIFPTIRIPVVAAIWRYTGLQPRDMCDEFQLLAGTLSSRPLLSLWPSIAEPSPFCVQLPQSINPVPVLFTHAGWLRSGNGPSVAIRLAPLPP